MGMEKRPSIMSTLNPNASEFVPAAARPVVTPEATPAAAMPDTTPAVEENDEYTAEWWSRIETDSAFREQYLSMFSFQNPEERRALIDSLEELSDLDQFHGYQEHLVQLEEEEILARNLQELDCFLDEDLRLTDTNNAKDVEVPQGEELQEQEQQQQQKTPWSRNQFQYQNKTMPQKVGSYPKKWNTYRLHQPRSDM
jgi:hypothetical protein